jgi:hypothetical protein
VTLALALSGDARAAAVPFTGTLELDFPGFMPYVPPVVIAGSGVANLNGSAGPGHLSGLEIPASVFSASGLVNAVTDPQAFPIRGLRYTVHNDAGAFGGSGGSGFGGVMALNGSAKVCLYGACSANDNIANVTVPLTVVGQGGTAKNPGVIAITVFGAAWTTGTAMITGNPTFPFTTTRTGGVSPLSSTTVVTLVTPIFISTSLNGNPVWPAFATLTLQFVPEPGTLALLFAGCVALAGSGRARMRSR